MSPENQPSPSLWRHRDYMLLWTGQIVSVVGSGISQITLPLIVLWLTHSPGQAGLVAALAGLPYPLFGLTAGALVDRWNRKRVMVVCEIINVCLTAGIALAIATGTVNIVQLYVAALIWGTVFVFFNVAEIAALSTVVTRDQLAAATAQNQATFGVAGLVGPPLGGALYQVARAVPFVVDALSYAISLISLLLIHTPFQSERADTSHNLLAEIRSGLRWLWQHHTIRAITVLTGGSNFLGGGYTLVLILLARQHHAGPAVIGGVFALASVGAITGSLLAPVAQRRLTVQRVVRMFFWFSTLLFPLLLLAPSVVAIGVVAATLWILGPIFNVVIISYRLGLIPEELQGRVNGAVRVVALGLGPPGAALTGLFLQWFGTTGTVWTITGGTLCLAIGAAVSPSIRHIEQPAEAVA